MAGRPTRSSARAPIAIVAAFLALAFAPAAPVGGAALVPHALTAPLNAAPATGIYFEPNLGQASEEVLFLIHGAYPAAALTRDGLAYVLREAPADAPADPARIPDPFPPALAAHVVTMALEGAAPAVVEGLDLVAGVSHFLLGNDPSAWARDVPHYARVAYRDALPGIDLLFYSTPDGELEYDFVLSPGASPDAIRLRFDGHDALAVASDGSLRVSTPLGGFSQKAPLACQGGVGVACEVVESAFALDGAGRARFQVGSYDPSRVLVIDPILAYQSHLGGSGFDRGSGIEVDALGRIHVSGSTVYSDLPRPLLAGAAPAGGSDGFLALLDPTGTALISITYLGGKGHEAVSAIGLHEPTGLAPAALPLVYVAGVTGSADLPTTPGAFQTTFHGLEDAFVAVVEPASGTLVASTYLGGGQIDRAFDIAVDATGAAYVTGTIWLSWGGAPGFPTTPGSFQPRPGGWMDAYVTKLAPNLGTLLYSTFLGGNNFDDGWAIAVDSAGRAVVAGSTGWVSAGLSNSFPLKDPLLRIVNGLETGYVSVLDPLGASLVFSTAVGGTDSRTRAHGVAVDAAGNIFVVGSTSVTNLPVINALQPAYGGGGDGFVAKIALDYKQFGFLTYLGGSAGEQFWDVAVTPLGEPVLVGRVGSETFPLVDPVLGSGPERIVRLASDGSSIKFSTRLGRDAYSIYSKQIAVDALGALYATGTVHYATWPTTWNAVQCAKKGPWSAYVVKILDVPVSQTTLAAAQDTVYKCRPAVP